MKLIKDKYLVTLAFISAILIFTNLHNISLWSPDEPRFGAIVKHMVTKNDYIIPVFNGKPLYWKPILVYWLMAFFSKIIGSPNELAMRLPSAISAYIILLVFYSFIKNRTNQKTAFLSSFILITNYTFLEQAKEAIIDMTLTLFMFLAVIFFYKQYEKNKKNPNFIYFSIFTAFAVLCKGPVGIIVPSIIAITYIAIEKNFKTIKHFFKPANIIVFLLIVLPWYIAATIIGGKEFFNEFIIRQNIIRFFKAFDHIQPFYYYFDRVLTHFFPWSLLLIPAFIYSIKEIKLHPEKNKLLKFSITWALSVFIFFSLSKSKRSQYILLFYPAASFITAHFANHILQLKENSKLPVNINWIKVPFVFVCLVFGIFFFAFPSFVKFFGYLPKNYFLESMIWCAIMFISIFSIAYALSEPNEIQCAKKSIISISIFSLIIFMFMVISLYPALDKVRSAIPYAEKINKIVKNNELISFYFERPEFVYYINRDHFKVLDQNETDKLIAYLKKRKKIYCIIPKKFYIDRYKYLKNIKHKIILNNLKGWKWDLLLISN